MTSLKLSKQSVSKKKSNSKQKPASNGQQSGLPTIVQRAQLDPGSLSGDEVLRLQSMMGNQAVSRLISPAPPPTNTPHKIQRNPNLKQLGNATTVPDKEASEDWLANTTGAVGGFGGAMGTGMATFKKGDDDVFASSPGTKAKGHSSTVGDDAAKGLNVTSASLGGIGGILGFVQSLRDLESDDVNKRIEAVFGLISNPATMIKSGYALAKEATKDDTSKTMGVAATVSGSVADGIEALKSGVLSIKGIYDAYKDATSPEGSSTAEKLESGMAVVRGLVEVAGKTVSVLKDILNLFENASAGLASAVPGLGIALNAVDIAINVYNIIKAKVSKAHVKAILKKNYWEIGGGTFSNKGKKRRQQQAEYTSTYEEEITRMITKARALKDAKKKFQAQLADPAKAANAARNIEKIDAKKKELEMLIDAAKQQNAALQENVSLTHLSQINTDRMKNAGFDIGVDLTKLIANVLTLVPEPGSQVAAISLKAAAAGASIGKKGFKGIRQWARNKAAKNPESFLNKIVDTTQSSEAQLSRKKQTVEYILSMIRALPTQEGSKEFATQAEQIERLITAAGVSPNALYRTANTKGLDAAITMLMKAQ